MVATLLLAVTFGQRLCFPLGTFQIPVSVPLAYIAAYLLLICGLGRINTARLLLFAASIVAMIITLFFSRNNFSTFSFFDLVVLYLVYLLTTDASRQEYLGCLRIYQRLMVALAAIGLAQLAEQFTTGTTFSLFDDIPSDFVLGGYNTRPVLFYGSDFHKSNAEFLLEPSFLSQFMALAVIIELLYFGNWWRLALYGAAIFASFSGTGMAMVVLFAVVAARQARRYELFAVLLLLVAGYLLVQNNLYVTAITGRIGEFNEERSSAFGRWVAPVRALDELVWSDYRTFLCGRGPGTVEQLGLTLYYQTDFPVIPKLLIEYGIIGTMPFLAFVLCCFWARTRSRVLSAALLVMYFVLSAGLLQPHTLYLFYVMVMMMPRQEGEAE